MYVFYWYLPDLRLSLLNMLTKVPWFAHDVNTMNLEKFQTDLCPSALLGLKFKAIRFRGRAQKK